MARIISVTARSSTALQWVCLATLVLLTIWTGGCDRVADRTQSSPCVMPSPPAAAQPGASSVRSEGDKFLPPYRRILECTGWFEYVDKNVDVVRYYDAAEFQSQQGPAVGLARYDNGRRIADVAIKDR